MPPPERKFPFGPSEDPWDFRNLLSKVDFASLQWACPNMEYTRDNFVPPVPFRRMLPAWHPHYLPKPQPIATPPLRNNSAPRDKSPPPSIATAPPPHRDYELEYGDGLDDDALLAKIEAREEARLAKKRKATTPPPAKTFVQPNFYGALVDKPVPKPKRRASLGSVYPTLPLPTPPNTQEREAIKAKYMAEEAEIAFSPIVPEPPPKQSPASYGRPPPSTSGDKELIKSGEAKSRNNRAPSPPGSGVLGSAKPAFETASPKDALSATASLPLEELGPMFYVEEWGKSVPDKIKHLPMETIEAIIRRHGDHAFSRRFVIPPLPLDPSYFSASPSPPHSPTSLSQAYREVGLTPPIPNSPSTPPPSPPPSILVPDTPASQQPSALTDLASPPLHISLDSTPPDSTPIPPSNPNSSISDNSPLPTPVPMDLSRTEMEVQELYKQQQTLEELVEIIRNKSNFQAEVYEANLAMAHGQIQNLANFISDARNKTENILTSNISLNQELQEAKNTIYLLQQTIQNNINTDNNNNNIYITKADREDGLQYIDLPTNNPDFVNLIKQIREKFPPFTLAILQAFTTTTIHHPIWLPKGIFNGVINLHHSPDLAWVWNFPYVYDDIHAGDYLKYVQIRAFWAVVLEKTLNTQYQDMVIRKLESIIQQQWKHANLNWKVKEFTFNINTNYNALPPNFTNPPKFNLENLNKLEFFNYDRSLAILNNSPDAIYDKEELLSLFGNNEFKLKFLEFMNPPPSQHSTPDFKKLQWFQATLAAANNAKVTFANGKIIFPPPFTYTLKNSPNTLDMELGAFGDWLLNKTKKITGATTFLDSLPLTLKLAAEVIYHANGGHPHRAYNTTQTGLKQNTYFTNFGRYTASDIRSFTEDIAALYSSLTLVNTPNSPYLPISRPIKIWLIRGQKMEEWSTFATLATTGEGRVKKFTDILGKLGMDIKGDIIKLIDSDLPDLSRYIRGTDLSPYF